MSESRVRKALAAALVVAVFAKLILYTDSVPRVEKFALFNIIAFPWDGADSRNIQAAAHCARLGFPYFGANECLRNDAPVRAVHPLGFAPVLNYPSYWPRLYGLFGDDSEAFFMTWWRLNALLLAAALLACCWRNNLAGLPLVLFSPVTLLAVERGNNDATTFFFTFVPLLAFAASTRAQSFFIGVAGALKVFPAAGWLAFGRLRAPFVTRDALLGAALASPLLVVSLLELPHFLRGTEQAFELAYGLPSLQHWPALQDRAALAALLGAAALAAMLASALVCLRRAGLRAAIERDLAQLAPADRLALAVSAAIFVVTFTGFASWAYRLIFVIPACLALSRGSSTLARLATLNGVAVLWLPLLPDGWVWMNLACYPLAVLLAGVLAVWLRRVAPG